MIVSTAYLGPVSYYATMMAYGSISLDGYEHYRKQTYRNRCRIATASACADLTIPILKHPNNCATKDIEISYTEAWQQIHWRTIESAYNSSPFFEYLRDDYERIYSSKPKFLLDFNMKLHEVVCENLGLSMPFDLTSEYVADAELDFRDSFNPKHEGKIKVAKYYQVFEQKYGFLEDMSIIDLIFNMGNESVLVLKETINLNSCLLSRNDSLV